MLHQAQIGSPGEPLSSSPLNTDQSRPMGGRREAQISSEDTNYSVTVPDVSMIDDIVQNRPVVDASGVMDLNYARKWLVMATDAIVRWLLIKFRKTRLKHQ